MIKPITIGKHLRKGIFALRDVRQGGFNACIVKLNKDIDSGDNYDLSDMESIETILHFGDRESIQITVDILNKILKDWK